MKGRGRSTSPYVDMGENRPESTGQECPDNNQIITLAARDPYSNLQTKSKSGVAVSKTPERLPVTPDLGITRVAPHRHLPGESGIRMD